MATIGSTDNIKKAGEDLQALASLAKVLGAEFLDISSDQESYTLTQTQLNDAVASLDVVSVQAAFDTAKATFISSTPV